MRFCSSLTALAIAAAASAQYSGTQPPPEDLKKGFDTISINDAKRVLTYLSTQCDGRGTGQPGFEKAAKFVGNEFHKLGLKPLGDDGTYFQSTDFTRWRFDPKTTSAKLEGSSFGLSGKDVALRTGPADLKVVGKPVWIHVTEQTVDLGDATFDGDVVIVEATGRTNGLDRDLASKGAAAILHVSPFAQATWRTAMGKVSPRTGGAPSGSISAEGAKRLMAALEHLKESAIPTKGADVTPFNAKLDLSGHLATESVRVGNVVAELPGSDPKLASEFVGIGGHLDHLGDVDGVVYPGADDDGSGSTAVIEIARAMTANPKKPKRSIVFMTFFGEEMGLLGSRFLTQHPPVPLDQMVSELQMDMVGRDSDGPQNGDRRRMDVAAENVDTIRLVGSKRISTELDKTIQSLNQEYIGFKFKYDAEDVYTRSDHYNFAAKGIPIAFLFDGFHPDYHRPTDTIEKIDWPKLTNAAKLYYLTGETIADQDAPPVKDVPQNNAG